MFRRWLSGFWRKYKHIFIEIGKMAGILLFISYLATGIISTLPKGTDKIEERKEVYKPRETVLIGSKVSEEYYKQNSELIEEFVQYCNKKDAKSAYNMLSNECKDILFPTLKEFEENYINDYYAKQRTYNIQSWIVKGNLVTYKIRMLDDLLSTGSYTNSVKYQDFITIDNNSENPSISVGGFVKREDLNVESETEEFYVKVTKRNIYVDYEEYEISIKNLTEETVILDHLENVKGITLFGKNGVNFNIENIRQNLLLKSDLKSGNTRTLNLKFKKNYSNSTSSDYIEFKNIVRDAEEYKKIDVYTDMITLKIDL